MEENLTVDNQPMESVQDDAVQVPGTDALSAALEGFENPAAAEAGNEQSAANEGETNKALKGRMKSYEKRGYARGQKEAEARWAEEKRGYEERLAKYAMRDMEDEAKALAKERGIPEDFALEYIKLKHGTQNTEEAKPARDDSGRFTSADRASNDAAQRRAEELMDQAEAFEEETNGMVSREQILDAFQNNEQLRNAVLSGKMDFTDIGNQLSKRVQRAPRMVRATNNGEIRPSSFATMSEAEFAKFNERVRLGAVFDSRR